MTDTSAAANLITVMLNAALDASTVEIDGESRVMINSEDLREAALGIVAMLIEADPRCQTPAQIREERDRAGRQLLTLTNGMRQSFLRTGHRPWNGRAIVPN